MRIDLERFTIAILALIFNFLALTCLILGFRKLVEVKRKDIEPEGIELYKEWRPSQDSEWYKKYIEGEK